MRDAGLGSAQPAGGMTDDDAPYVEEQKEKIRAAGLEGQTTFLPNVDREGKLRLANGASLLQVIGYEQTVQTAIERAVKQDKWDSLIM